eukprot:Amastigsp_a676282_157.p2 type:complete len:254 gc:universal Amastigsp_a676282_157:793-32(-)
MRDNDRRLEAAVGGVLAREHVDLALVHAELADVSAEEEDIRALHCRVEDLRRGLVIALLAPHDGGAAADARNRGVARNVEDHGPVLLRAAVDLIGTPDKAHMAHVHAARLPHLDHVLADDADLAQIAAHFVVEQRKPVRNPKDKVAARFGELVHIDGLENALSDVHAARRLEAVIAHGTLRVGKKGRDLVRANDLFADRVDESHPLVEREHGAGVLRCRRSGKVRRIGPLSAHLENVLSAFAHKINTDADARH